MTSRLFAAASSITLRNGACPFQRSDRQRTVAPPPNLVDPQPLAPDSLTGQSVRMTAGRDTAFGFPEVQRGRGSRRGGSRSLGRGRGRSVALPLPLRRVGVGSAAGVVGESCRVPHASRPVSRGRLASTPSRSYEPSHACRRLDARGPGAKHAKGGGPRARDLLMSSNRGRRSELVRDTDQTFWGSISTYTCATRARSVGQVVGSL